MATIITPQVLKEYVLHGKRHKAYDETVKIMQRMKFHADGERPMDHQISNPLDKDNPGNLINARRPSESETIKVYRNSIFVSITESVVSKIISSLSKIRKSQDWSIKYDTSKASKKLEDGETLSDYCEKKFPYFTSVTNWIFNVCLKYYLVDPNAVCVMMPLTTEVKETEFLKPWNFIYTSDQVLEYVHDDYCIVKSTDRATYADSSGKKFFDGEIYFVITTEEIQRWEQTDSSKNFNMAVQYKHGLGRFPAFKLGGMFYKAMDTAFIFKSRINAIVPRLNEATREYSDLQAEVVQHVHSESAIFTSNDCNDCKGFGVIPGVNGAKERPCQKCNGMGKVITSPFSNIMVKPAKPGELAPPWPPKVYIQKQVEIVKIQDERIDKHIWQALSAINMEFLAQTPLSQSGVAKEVDKDELNNFVSAIAEDIVAIMDKIYFFVNEYRNRIRIPNTQERTDQLPVIAVPQKFDLLNPNYLIDEIDKAKKGVLNPVIIKALEQEYANKKFIHDDEIGQELKLVLTLDPFPGFSTDEKSSMLMNKGMTQTDYIISCYIQPFVTRAVEEVEGFIDKELKDQQAIMNQYAAEKEKEMSAKAAVMKIVSSQAQPLPAAGAA